MKTSGGSDAAKRRAGESAAEAVTDGDVVGLGTGSTAAHAIRAIGRRVNAGLDVRGVPTSFASRRLARERGIPLVDLDAVFDPVASREAPASDGGTGIDVAIDGADQIADTAIIKGGGAAHAREKVVAAAADRFLVVVDPTKVVDVLDRSVPVEVLPDARATVARTIRRIGGEPILREATRKDGPVVTDNGNLVLDCDFGEIDDPDPLATRLASIPGVLEHGLFVGLANEIHLGNDEGVEIRDCPSS
ncbi:ribose-5-phosphate isomerase RpiA [Halorubrum vacuolatum]|uniref:Ribose-5-phosphate isomerase A n=1 Tax=Halorubrum vacuolatum TaxID=63740 RepID=A0A238WDI9_HALVU|nr:ribose-5-phosphate isomerase RpiA [Halorubrum vacuolatum]SNR44635.1 ribose-5-phosphate isomerase [Halorubrum vacuolatum]